MHVQFSSISFYGYSFAVKSPMASLVPIFISICTLLSIFDKVTGYTKYPKYFEIQRMDSEYAEYSGFYMWKNKPFPYYSKTDDNYVMYLKDGQWIINMKNDNGQGYIKSRPKGLREPPNNRLWMVWNGTAWEGESSISVTFLVYPEAYTLEYVGDDQQVKRLFEKQNFAGKYNNSNLEWYDYPYYIKEGTANVTTMYLYKSSMGFWSVGRYLTESGLLRQDGKKEPAPSENKEWMVKMSYSYIEFPGVMLTKNIDNGLEHSETVQNEMNMLLLVISISVLVFILLALIASYCLYQRRKKVEEPKIDVNIDYGHEKEDYDEHDTCVIDNNDYYKL